MSELTVKKSGRAGSDVIYTVLGAFLMGMLWLIRGAQGWESSWGLLNTGFIYTSYIICLKGGRKKLGLGWLSITALSFMVTTPAWATIVNQIRGVLDGPSEYTAYVSVPSGIFLIFCVGFGMAALFGILLGRAYSDVEWSFKQLMIVLAIFFAVRVAAKLTVSQLILNVIQPETQSMFKDGLYKIGCQDPGWLTYIRHYGNEAWFKTVDGGRNYYASVKAISSVFSAVAAVLATRFIVKDKRAAKTGLVTCLAFGFSITVSDLFFFFANGGYHGIQGFSLPDFVKPMPMWEYMTGFIAGGIITAVLLKMKPADDVDDLFVEEYPLALKEIITFLVGYVAIICISMVRPIMERYTDSINQMIFLIPTALVAFAFIALIAKNCGINVSKVDMRYYCAIMVVLTVAFSFIIYMFFGTEELVAYHDIGSLHNILISVSFVLFMLWAIPNHIKARKIKFENINSQR